MWTVRSCMQEQDTKEEHLEAAQFESAVCDLDIKRLDKLLWFRVLRRFIRFSSKLNSIDITKIQGDERHKLASQTRHSCWPDVARILLSFVGLKLLISTYNSYQFDLYHFMYTKQANSTSGLTFELRRKMEEARENLFGIGILYENLNFFIETWNLVFMAAIVYNNFCLYILFGFYYDIHLIIGGIILDLNSMKRSYLRIVLKQMRRFIVSSRNFHQISIVKAVMRHQASSRHLVKSIILRHKNEHRQLITRLKSTLLAGHFGPTTWRLEWISHLAWLNVCMTIIIAFYSIGLIMLVLVYLPIRTGVDKFDWWQLMKSSDEVILAVFCLSAASFYIPNIMTSNMDHMSHMNKLIDLIRECKRKNISQVACILRLIKSNPTHRTDHLNELCKEPKLSIANQWDLRYQAKQLNDNLLFVLVHYRISVSLSKSVNRTSAVCLFGGMSTMFLFPIVFLLHAPYVNDPLVRQTYGHVCSGNALAIILLMSPMCNLNTKSYAIYRAMSSLLAHSIESQSALGALNEPDLYDNHLVGLLRKELDHPDRLARQFTIVILGIPVTYPNLLRIHFWFGLLMLAVINGLSSGNGDLFGSFFGDPLGFL